jgi:glycosyltransferase involved in cell wall biosynthesis
MLEPRAFEHGAWKKRLAWTLYQKKDLTRARVLCATSTEEAQSIRGCGFQQPIAVVPNGVTLPKLKEGRNQRRIVRTMLFLSRIHPMKGLPLLVEAWKRAQPLGWRVLVVGPDESGHRETVEEAVSAADLKDVFEFVGPATEAKKARFFEIADVFVLPTMSENFGVVVAEALAHGVPVITTTGAPWRGLVENDCGWWVRPEVGELASAILEATALTDVERAAMGSRGRSWMERDFSWPSLAMRMRSVYEWVVSGGKTPDCMIEGHRAS